MRRWLALAVLLPAAAGAQAVEPNNPLPIIQPPPLQLPPPARNFLPAGPSDSERDRQLRDNAEKNRRDKEKSLEQIDQMERQRQQDQQRSFEPAKR